MSPARAAKNGFRLTSGRIFEFLVGWQFLWDRKSLAQTHSQKPDIYQWMAFGMLEIDCGVRLETNGWTCCGR